ncbi:TetR/AcrR family transcriptional regulator [Companilactobacillus nantensis]|uniref:TetR family transcriptional regulator n=1 Tax=Companilactobacillus nantensis DSM 16982 TaxID=1423774 RepID=A0A0R1WP26_9LACO|nr:TetR/AcrR family transcriptional regulator [Companilactobacillus nantensis]KRM17972.1 TetR family transcriptional regulator [Companilactobacillus nantensis DSM 16982]GEO63635.1 TetR family transcriptional regulator [Companilactobacillus nantensis]
MQNTTEPILIDALNTILQTKPIDKITVKDIVTECQLTRQTFYNHFSDIYELVEFSARQNAENILDNLSDYDNWQQGFYDIMIALRNSSNITQNVYKSAYRDLMEKYIYQVIYGYIIKVVEKQATGMTVDQKHKDFIAHFYSLAFIALILEWIMDGMKDDPQDIVDQTAVLVKGDFKKALNKYAE